MGIVGTCLKVSSTSPAPVYIVWYMLTRGLNLPLWGQHYNNEKAFKVEVSGKSSRKKNIWIALINAADAQVESLNQKGRRGPSRDRSTDILYRGKLIRISDADYYQQVYGLCSCPLTSAWYSSFAGSSWLYIKAANLVEIRSQSCQSWPSGLSPFVFSPPSISCP